VSQHLRRGWRFIKRIKSVFSEAGGMQHSGAIAYFGLLSILPVVILTCAILAHLAEQLPAADDGSNIIDKVLDEFATALPFLAGEVRQLIHSLAETRTSIGLLTAVLLLFGASAVFTAMERGVNAMLGTTRRRHFLLTKLILAGMVISIGAALFAWQVVKSVSSHLFSTAGLAIPMWILNTAFLHWLIAFTVVAVGYYLLLKFMAAEPFPRKHRWIGALVFAFLFHAARWGLQLYLDHIISFQQMYGAAGAFLGLIIWLYIAALVLLLSCTVVRCLTDIAEEKLALEPNT
jgi:YihY family inner membrane protein